MNPSFRIPHRPFTRIASLATLAWLALGPAFEGRLAAGPSTGGEFSLVGTVVGGGGQAAGGYFTLDGTAGLPAAGASVGGNFVITGGLIGVYVVPGDVELTLTRTDNGQVRLDWSAQAEGYLLEFTAQVGADAVWTRVTPRAGGQHPQRPLRRARPVLSAAQAVKPAPRSPARGARILAPSHRERACGTRSAERRAGRRFSRARALAVRRRLPEPGLPASTQLFRSPIGGPAVGAEKILAIPAWTTSRQIWIKSWSRSWVVS